MAIHPLTRRYPVTVSLTVAAVVAGIICIGLWYGLSRNWALTSWLFWWFLAVSLVTILVYGYDKRQAAANGWRVPERTLHILALFGGSVGAFIGMRWFRHKTVKGPFRIVFFLIVAVQVAALMWLAKQTWLT